MHSARIFDVALSYISQLSRLPKPPSRSSLRTLADYNWKIIEGRYMGAKKNGSLYFASADARVHPHSALSLIRVYES